MFRWHSAVVVLAVLGMAPHPVAGQTGLEVGGVPAINFDADEGFGYGAIVELYHYGDGSQDPYVWTLQPTVFLTTEGRRDVTLFFDAPGVSGGWRVDAFVGSQEQIATPYYGLGNTSLFDPGRVTDENPYYYRFGRTRRSGAVNAQRRIGGTALRILAGAGVAHSTVVAVPRGDGTTLLAEQLATGEARLDDGWTGYVRAGMVWDTRDRETGPTRGSWSELLIMRGDYTRWTLTDRRYVSLGPVVFAHRLLVQSTSAGVALHDLHGVQTSFKQQEGIGGAKSVRGVLKNRFVGRGMMIWNVEARVRAADFRLLGRPFHAVLSTFADAGRVWRDDLHADEIFSGLHRGYGGGVRLGMGENFTVAADGGTSSETGFQLYIGLGYLY